MWMKCEIISVVMYTMRLKALSEKYKTELKKIIWGSFGHMSKTYKYKLAKAKWNVCTRMNLGRGL